MTESEGSGTEMTPEQEARHIIKKIRHHVRLLNRKWAEVNQRSNEWQHKLEETLEVGHVTLTCTLIGGIRYKIGASLFSSVQEMVSKNRLHHRL